MCGILIALSRKPLDRAHFDAARDTMIHRGPDAQQSVFLEADTVGLGHTRLSIIDLSNRANQPMQDGNLWVTYNGEIYNFPQLREELELAGCQFKTNSDTEVLLHGYRVWEESLCERLLGMFAFAVYDADTGCALLGRDHFGQKPLYYADLGDVFIAASEIKAIKACAGRGFALRKESVVDAMIQDFVAEPRTWFEDINVVPAGHQMRIERTESGSIRSAISNYWTFTPDANPQPITQGEALEQLGVELREATSSHMLADVEVGSFLSGGIDSTCITTLASELLDTSIQTFSIGFGGNDELPAARQTAARICADHHEDNLGEGDFQYFKDRALAVFDHPFADTSLVPTEHVSRLAARKVKVVLTGDGGDEVFGGYSFGRYLAPRLGPSPLLVPTVSGLRSSASFWWDALLFSALGSERWGRVTKDRIVNSRRLSVRRRSILAPELLQSIDGYDPSWAHRQHSIDALDPFRKAQWIGIKVALASRMLVKVDRASMAHSLETRAPFLSPRLAEFALSLPRPVTNPTPDWYKSLLRQWLDGRIDSSVLNANKRGFDLPKEWSSLDQASLASGEELLPNCVSAALIRPMGWHRLRRAPRLLWYFTQIERALDTGMFAA